MLKIENFKKSYNRQIVLQIDNLIIEPGINWIQGTNGTGKSTFLKSVAGIIAFEGDIMLGSGISIKKQSVVYRKLVNFAEAEPVFPEFLTGIDLVRLFAKAKGETANKADYFIESMKMESYMGDPVGTYSSGMLKKLSLVLAFIGNAELILLDEPLITMDNDSLKTLYTWIAEYKFKHGTSFLLSSHQAFEDTFFPSIKKLLVENRTINYL